MKKKLFTTLLAVATLVSTTGFGYGAECSLTQVFASQNGLLQLGSLQENCLQIENSQLQCLSNFARFCETGKIGEISGNSGSGCETESIENICDIENFCDIGNIFDKLRERADCGATDRESGSGACGEGESKQSESTQGESMQSGNASQDNTSQGNAQQGSAPQSGYGAQVVSLVNEERTAQGLSNLARDAQLTRLAQLKAEDMAENKYFSHTSPTYGTAFDMLKTYGVSYTTAGENIATGQKTAEAVMEGWMNSQGHRANILNSAYTGIGVGYAKSSDGTTYWVQIFKG